MKNTVRESEYVYCLFDVLYKSTKQREYKDNLDLEHSRDDNDNVSVISGTMGNACDDLADNRMIDGMNDNRKHLPGETAANVELNTMPEKLLNSLKIKKKEMSNLIMKDILGD